MKRNHRKHKGLKAIYGKKFKKAFEDIQSYEMGNVQEIEITKIKANPFQPREVFHDRDIKELAQSIKNHGLISPIGVIKDLEGYFLVTGERRLRAHKVLNLSKIKALVLDFQYDQIEEMALIENVQREDLNPIEQAKAITSLIKKHNLTQEQIAQKIAKSRVYVTNSLRLLKLPFQVQEMLLQNTLTQGHGKVLLGIKSRIELIDMAQKSSDQKWSVKKLENQIKKSHSKTIIQKKPKALTIINLEKAMEAKLDTKVKVSKKRIVIDYNSPLDLKRILTLIGFTISEK